MTKQFTNFDIFNTIWHYSTLFVNIQLFKWICKSVSFGHYSTLFVITQLFKWICKSVSFNGQIQAEYPNTFFPSNNSLKLTGKGFTINAFKSFFAPINKLIKCFKKTKTNLFVVLVVCDVCLAEVVGRVLGIRSRFVGWSILRDLDIRSENKIWNTIQIKYI